MRRFRHWTLTVLWAAVILVVTSVPVRSLPDRPYFPHADKLIHACLYAVLALLAWRASVRTRPPHPSFWGLVLAIALFALIDEWHQRFVDGRSADPRDWAADIGGALAALALAQFHSLSRRGRVD